jgi:hypothetical protein
VFFFIKKRKPYILPHVSLSHSHNFHCSLFPVPITASPAYRRQYCICCCLQPNATSFLCPQWPVSPLLLPTTTCHLLSVLTVASIASTVAYNYMPSPFSAHSGQYHLYCCLQLHAISFLCPHWPILTLLLPTTTCLLLSLPSDQYHLYCCLQAHAISFLCPQWPVSFLLLHRATCLLLPLPTVASFTSTVSYSYISSLTPVYSGHYHLYCCLQLHAVYSHCIQ